MINFEKIYLEEHVQNRMSYSKIREKYNISRGQWDYYVRQKLGYSNDSRKYKANDDFFDIIDSEIKAYLLGFLYADGYISKDGRIGIRLNIKDEEIIKLIQQYIAPNSPITYTDNQNIKRKPQVNIRFKSKKILKRLQDLGFTTDKTHTECNILQHIPDNVKRHFIRGYCDGDGSVRADYQQDNKCLKISIVFCNGTSLILENIKDYFNLPCYLRHYKSWYTLEYNKMEYVYKICIELYSNCSFYLKRKYNNAMSIIEYCNNTELNSRNKRLESV